jgi:hypothetical protein
MNRLLVASVLVVGLLPGMGAALEISNIKLRYGPYGATRTELPLKVLPKDVLVITYDLSGLSVDAKTGKAKYITTLELLNADKKVIFSKDTTNEPILQLGGGKMPGDLFVQVGAKQAPGKYTIHLKVTDKLEKNPNKAGSEFNYPYEVLPDKFGLAGVSAPAIGVPGLPYAAEFALVNFTLDKKNLPKGEVNVRVLDEKGKEVDAVKHILPVDLPAGVDLTEANILPFRHPIYLNRPGRFTVEITAEDKLGNTKVEMRYPFTVIDINALQGK